MNAPSQPLSHPLSRPRPSSRPRLARRCWAAALLVLAAALAGCSDGGGKATDDVVVLSGATVSATPSLETKAPGGKGLGHIAGFVVDDAIHPVPGAVAALAGLDLKDTTDRNGGFEFVDLPPGKYLVRFNATGHRDAEAVLEVKEDRFTRAKVILERIRPPDPYTEVAKFEGYVSLTDNEFFSGFLFRSGHSFSADPVGLQGVVVEAVMDPYEGAGLGGRNGFDLSIQDEDCCHSYWSAHLPSPFWAEVPVQSMDGTGNYTLSVSAWSSPLPETNKSYEAFVSLFYNAPPPAGYALIGQTP